MKALHKKLFIFACMCTCISHSDVAHYNASTLKELGQRAIAADDLVTAATYYKELALREPDNIDYLYHTAYLLNNSGNSLESIKYYRSALARQQLTSSHKLTTMTHLGFSKALLATGNL